MLSFQKVRQRNWIGTANIKSLLPLIKLAQTITLMKMNTEKQIIRPTTPVKTLVEWGIVSQRMWKNVEPHAMYEAENLLNEYDWEWD